MKHLVVISSLAIAIALAALGYFHLYEPASSKTVEHVTPLTVTNSPGKTTSAAASHPSTTSSGGMPVPPPISSMNEGAALIENLANSSQAQDWIKAANILDNCAKLNSLKELSRSIREFDGDSQQLAKKSLDGEIERNSALCASISPRQIEARINLIERAISAGEPGAAVAFLRAGPFGEPRALETRPDDILVQQWKEKALEQLLATARRGDVESISQLSSTYQSGLLGTTSAALALKYETAKSAILAARGVDVRNDRLIAFLGANLSDREKEESIAAGKQLASSIIQRRNL